MHPDADEEKRISEESDKMYGDMNTYQRDITGLDVETIRAIKAKHALASNHS